MVALEPGAGRRGLGGDVGGDVGEDGAELVAAAPKPTPKKKKIKPNDRCPCNSGKKYKKCCRDKDRAAAAASSMS